MYITRNTTGLGVFLFGDRGEALGARAAWRPSVHIAVRCVQHLCSARAGSTVFSSTRSAACCRREATRPSRFCGEVRVRVRVRVRVGVRVRVRARVRARARARVRFRP